MVTIGEKELSGDGPGAAAVKITVDGRELVLPRIFMLEILTAAYNRQSDKLHEANAVKLGDVAGIPAALENALYAIEWAKRSVETIETIRKHVESPR